MNLWAYAPAMNRWDMQTAFSNLPYYSTDYNATG